MGGESVKGFGTEWIEGGMNSCRCCRGCLSSEWSNDAYASASQVVAFCFLSCDVCHKQDVVMYLMCHPVIA